MNNKAQFMFMSLIFFFFNKDFIYSLSEREEGKGMRERGRETSMCKIYIHQLSLTRPQPSIWPTTQACALTGNQTGDLLDHRLALNPPEPHQPRLFPSFSKALCMDLF